MPHHSQLQFSRFLQKSYGMEQQPLSLFSSPPSALTIEKVEDLELVIDRSDRPSPVSVLEPLFTEDDISPSSPAPGKPANY